MKIAILSDIHANLHALELDATFEHIARHAKCDVLLFGHTHPPYQKWVDKTCLLTPVQWGNRKTATCAQAT